MSEPEVPILEYSTQKRWRVGTLTYTFGGLAALFFWLLWGDFALNMKERSVPPTLQLLLKDFHASDFVLGLLITSLPQAMGLFLAPVLSYWSDRLRTRWGRRIPFLFVTAPLAFLSMLGLAYSPQIGRWAAHLFHARHVDPLIIGSFAIFWAIFEVCSIVVNAVVFPGLINDVVPHNVLGRFYGLFRIMSLGAGMLFFYNLMGKVETFYEPIFIGIGALYAVSFGLMCWKVREGEYPPAGSPSAYGADEALAEAEAEIEAAPATGEMIATGATPAVPMEFHPPAPHVSRLSRLGTATANYFRESFTIPFYYWFFASFALANMAFTPINTFSVPFAKAIGLSMDTYGKLSALQLLLSLLQAYPIGWLCDRFHPLRMTLISLVLYATTTLLAFFFVRTPVMFGFAHVICGTCAGFWLTATAPLGPALLPKNKFTQFLSANNICVATGMLIIAGACGRFLDIMHGEYRYIYLWACFFMCGAIVVTLMLYRSFMQQGGPQGYVAPQ